MKTETGLPLSDEDKRAILAFVAQIRANPQPDDFQKQRTDLMKEFMEFVRGYNGRPDEEPDEI